MTDRAKAILVHLDDDYRIGDGDSGADRIMDAIATLKGVAKVEPLTRTSDDYLARERARLEVRQQIMDVLYPRTEE